MRIRGSIKTLFMAGLGCLAFSLCSCNAVKDKTSGGTGSAPPQAEARGTLSGAETQEDTASGETGEADSALDNGGDEQVEPQDDARARSHGKKPKKAQAASVQIYTIFDARSGLPVETYRLPAPWQAQGFVDNQPNRYPFWRCFFVNRDNGAVMISNGQASVHHLGSFTTHPFIKTPSVLAEMLHNDLHLADSGFGPITLTSCEVHPSKDPNVLQVAQYFTQGMGGQLQFFPYEMVSRCSFKKDGKNWKGGSYAFMLANNYDTGYGPEYATSDVILMEYRSFAAPAPLFASQEPDLKAILKSKQISQDWIDYVASVHSQINQNGYQDFKELNAVLQQTSRIVASTCSSASSASDRVSSGWSEAIRGVDTYEDPFNSSRQMEVPVTIDHAWVNSSGEMLNGDANYNPNTDSAYNDTEWVQLK